MFRNKKLFEMSAVSFCQSLFLGKEGSYDFSFGKVIFEHTPCSPGVSANITAIALSMLSTLTFRRVFTFAHEMGHLLADKHFLEPYIHSQTKTLTTLLTPLHYLGKIATYPKVVLIYLLYFLNLRNNLPNHERHIVIYNSRSILDQYGGISFRKKYTGLLGYIYDRKRLECKKMYAFVSFAGPLANCIFTTCNIALLALIHNSAPIPTPYYDILKISLTISLVSETFYSLSGRGDYANIRNTLGFPAWLLTCLTTSSFFFGSKYISF